jgi:hypothetical protein
MAPTRAIVRLGSTMGCEGAVAPQELDIGSLRFPALGPAAVGVTDVDLVAHRQANFFHDLRRQDQHGCPGVNDAANSLASYLVGRQRAISCANEVGIVGDFNVDAKSGHAVAPLNCMAIRPD